MTRHLRSFFATLFILGCVSGISNAQINVSITNEGNSDFFVTPLWFGFHDGSFDLFDDGQPASSALELIAEEGDVSGLQNAFTAEGHAIQGVAANAAGFGGAPVIDPGETATASITPVNPAAYRYLSFASMVIPSNDAFIGNSDPTAYQVFDSSGDFQGPLTIQIFANDIWDAGTEVNNTFGAAFSGVGGDGVAEGGTVGRLGMGGLDNFAGTGIPTGDTISDLIGDGELLATIHVTQTVPEPTSLGMISLGGLALGLLRRRRDSL